MEALFIAFLVITGMSLFVLWLSKHDAKNKHKHSHH